MCNTLIRYLFSSNTIFKWKNLKSGKWNYFIICTLHVVTERVFARKKSLVPPWAMGPLWSDVTLRRCLCSRNDFQVSDWGTRTHLPRLWCLYFQYWNSISVTITKLNKLTRSSDGKWGTPSADYAFMHASASLWNNCHVWLFWLNTIKYKTS